VVAQGSPLARPTVSASAADQVAVVASGVAPAPDGSWTPAAEARAVRPVVGEPANPDAAVSTPTTAVTEGKEKEPGDAKSGVAVATTVRSRDTVQRLVAAERAAIAAADPKALADLVIPTVFGFGLDASEVAEGRDAVVAQLARDLGAPPAGGFAVESKALAIGQDRDAAWIAEELEVRAPGREPRRFAITELAAAIDGTWRIVALHWATPVDDATAERLATAGALPAPRPIVDRRDGVTELDRAVRVAFMNRLLFARASSERADAFNLGSGGERARGGAAIKRVFGRLKAQIRVRNGARIVDGSAWDPAQRAAPWIGWAALNVEFTAVPQRGLAPATAEPVGSDATPADEAAPPSPSARAPAEITQTFRVLAIMLKEGTDWKIVQTQWSNGGPFR
jgi:hypothetical protein